MCAPVLYGGISLIEACVVRILGLDGFGRMEGIDVSVADFIFPIRSSGLLHSYRYHAFAREESHPIRGKDFRQLLFDPLPDLTDLRQGLRIKDIVHSCKRIGSSQLQGHRAILGEFVHRFFKVSLTYWHSRKGYRLIQNL